MVSGHAIMTSPVNHAFTIKIQDVIDVYRAHEITLGTAIFLLVDGFNMSPSRARKLLA